jgi:hypothetical protein
VRRRVDGLVARVASTRPTTIAGYRAMARAAFVLWAAGDGEIPESDGGETALLARVLIRDLAGVEVDTADSVVAADVGSVGAVVH